MFTHKQKKLFQAISVRRSYSFFFTGLFLSMLSEKELKKDNGVTLQMFMVKIQRQKCFFVCFPYWRGAAASLNDWGGSWVAMELRGDRGWDLAGWFAGPGPCQDSALAKKGWTRCDEILNEESPFAAQQHCSYMGHSSLSPGWFLPPQRMQKSLPQAAQAVGLFRNRMSTDVSVRTMQSSGLAHSVWLLLQKEKESKKRHSTRKRSPKYVTGRALLTDIMWDALFSKFLHLTSKNYVYFMDQKREIFLLTVNLGHILWYLLHTAWAGAWAVNDLSSSNLHIPVT